ncbi:MAG: periplasmic binding family protein [Deltaproteobacteria bacterium]|nr:periplasmic binding family protein [Deltaproteobacteria bacterium]
MRRVKFISLCCLSGLLCFGSIPFSGVAFGEVKTFNVTASYDFSGPYADIMKNSSNAQKIIFAWWNQEVGKGLGVQLDLKGYDFRYDATITASKWPGVLSGDKPIAHLGIGGPDVAALMKRLPNDKVPLFLATGTYGFIWGPGFWVFNARPTYWHEAAGFYKYMYDKQFKRKIRIALINTQGIPAYEEFVTASKKYAAEAADAVVEVVGVEWVPLRPVDLTSQIARLVKEKPDFIDVYANTPQVIATLRALQTLNKQIPIRMSSHNGIEVSAKALGNLKDFEGCYDSYSLRPALDHSVPAYEIFSKYKDQIDKEADYNGAAVQAMMNATMVFRAVERVIKSKGTEAVNGENLYNSMFEVNTTSAQLLGLSNDQYFTRERPFPAKNLACMGTTVKNEKQVLVSKEWMPIPEVPKW